MHILILCGGGGPEHDISLVSADFIEQKLKEYEELDLVKVVIDQEGKYWAKDNSECELRLDGKLYFPALKNQKIKIDYVIPCIHGFPGETGDIQSLLEMAKIPYLGSSSESSKNCFNKVTSKLWFSAMEIPNTPYIFLSTIDEIDKAYDFFNQHQKIFIKTSSQGSSIGCYKVEDKNSIKDFLMKAFELSPYVLVEQALAGARELEVAVYEYHDKLIATAPGEISCPNSFYSYEEKYTSNSNTETHFHAEGLDKDIEEKLKNYSLKVFKEMKLRHLSRIDFFLTPDNRIYLNEINTFPGLTPISMFPKMMEANGDSFQEFLREKFH